MRQLICKFSTQLPIPGAHEKILGQYNDLLPRYQHILRWYLHFQCKSEVPLFRDCVGTSVHTCRATRHPACHHCAVPSHNQAQDVIEPYILTVCLKSVSYLFSVSSYLPRKFSLPSWLSISGITLFCFRQTCIFTWSCHGIYNCGRCPLILSSLHTQIWICHTLAFFQSLVIVPLPAPHWVKGH